MQLTKEKFANTYKRWTEKEDRQLVDLFLQGQKPGELAKVFQRNRGAIESRIKKVDFTNRSW